MITHVASLLLSFRHFNRPHIYIIMTANNSGENTSTCSTLLDKLKS